MSKFCSNCGKPVLFGTVFCTNCGKVIPEFDVRVNTTFFNINNRSTFNEKLEKIKLSSSVPQILVNCKILSLTVNGGDSEDIEISWYETGSWGLEINHTDTLLSIREQSYLGLQNISDVFVPEKYRHLNICIPKKYNGAIELSTGTGTIELSNFEATGRIGVVSTIGYVDIKHVKGNQSAYIQTTAGKIRVVELYTDEELSITTNIGEIRGRRIDSGTRILLKSQTGIIDCIIADDEANYKTIKHSNRTPYTVNEASGQGHKLLDVSTTIGDIKILFEGSEHQAKEA